MGVDLDQGGYSRAAPRRGDAAAFSLLMANIKSQKKRILRAERERLENRRYTSKIKTFFRRLEHAVAAGDGCAGRHRAPPARAGDRQGGQARRSAPQLRRPQEVTRGARAARLTRRRDSTRRFSRPAGCKVNRLRSRPLFALPGNFGLSWQRPSSRQPPERAAWLRTGSVRDGGSRPVRGQRPLVRRARPALHPTEPDASRTRNSASARQPGAQAVGGRGWPAVGGLVPIRARGRAVARGGVERRPGHHDRASAARRVALAPPAARLVVRQAPHAGWRVVRQSSAGSEGFERVLERRRRAGRRKQPHGGVVNRLAALPPAPAMTPRTPPPATDPPRRPG